MMRLFTLFIIFFSVSGTVWSMWLSSELKNEEARLKSIKSKIIEIDEKIRLAEAEWSFITNPKHIEYLNNKYLKLKTIPINDITSIKTKDTILSKKLDKSNKILKEIN